MLFSNPNALVYLMRNGLIVAGKRLPEARLKFPPELVANMEIIDRDKFVTLCQQFFQDHGLHGKRVLIALDNTLVFRKNIELDRAVNADALCTRFVDSMPFAEGKRACIAVKSNSLLQVIATNADIYQSAAEALHACGIAKLVAVKPAAAYSLSGSGKDFTALVPLFFKETPASKMTDFNIVEPL